MSSRISSAVSSSLSAHRFKEDSRVSTWLCAIARNQWNKYQAKHPPVEPLTPEHPANQTTEEQVLQSLAHSDLMKTLHRMPEPYREARKADDVPGNDDNGVWTRDGV